MLTRGLVVLGLIASSACSGPADDGTWHIVGRHLRAATLSVWGTSETDVFVVGGDLRDGRGPLALHYNGADWQRIDTGQPNGDLWWVFGFANGPVYMGGNGGVILRYENGVVTKLMTPGTDTVFGIWGASPADVWAVGGASNGTNAFAWRLVGGGDTWVVAQDFPIDLANDSLWKVYGRSANDAWMVGTSGKAVRWDGAMLTSMSLVPIIGHSESLFTVHADENGFAAVGGFGTGTILENDGSGWRNTTPATSPSGLVGVCLSHAGSFAVGDDGTMLTREGSTWSTVDLGQQIDESFHATWVDPQGSVWAVGGNILLVPVVDGIVMHRGSELPEISL